MHHSTYVTCIKIKLDIYISIYLFIPCSYIGVFHVTQYIFFFSTSYLSLSFLPLTWRSFRNPAITIPTCGPESSLLACHFISYFISQNLTSFRQAHLFCSSRSSKLSRRVEIFLSRTCSVSSFAFYPVSVAIASVLADPVSIYHVRSKLE